ncbi:MAG: DNA polymerase III subunit gamma/tau [Chloroflexi bacterium]|nr:DNA polymerase III subunit gamma/tau [Chloroflexota bacterium]
MASQVFYRKWRPQTLADVVGQEQVTKTLRNALGSGRVSHAYLFCGPRGTGKTSTGRILAKAVNCLTNQGKGEPCNTCRLCQATTEGRALDVIEIDAASNRGIDDIRDLRERVNYAPNEARYKVYIIDEVHMLTKEASNALLKTLEEPPPHAIFVLATTEAHKVLATIMSRCQRFDFKRLSQADVVARLTQICAGENINIEPEGLHLIARSATGSLRDAANLLEQLTTYYGNELKLAQVQAILGITGDARAKELVKHIVHNDIAAGIATVNSVSRDGVDLKQFNREVVSYLRGLLLTRTNASEAVDFTPEDLAELKTLAGQASLQQILKAVKIFGQLESSLDSYATLPVELALVDCALAEEKREATPPETVPQKPKATVTPAAPKARVSEPAPQKPHPVAPVSTPPSRPPVASTGPAVAKPEPVATPAPVGVGRPAGAPPPGNEFDWLKQNWKRAIDEAPAAIKKSSAIALLRSAGVRPVALENDTVTLSFRYQIHKENAEKPENLQVAEKIVSNFLGRPCRVRCVHEPEDNHLVETAKKIAGAQVISVEEK